MDTCIAQLPAENAASEVASGICRLVRPQATSDIASVPAADRAGISRWAASFRQLSASSPFRWGSMAPSCRWTSIGSWERRFSRPTATTATATTPAASAGWPSTKHKSAKTDAASGTRAKSTHTDAASVRSDSIASLPSAAVCRLKKKILKKKNTQTLTQRLFICGLLSAG
jgi:hypothetical protein